MKNGKRYSGAFIGDEVCLPKSCIALNNDLSLKEARYCMTVRDLLNVLDHSYGGLFSQYDGLKLMRSMIAASVRMRNAKSL